MKFNNLQTFLFYDYETFGTNPYLDKPAQFACIRTDMNLNIIDNPNCFYCFPPDDYLPDPESILITQITPQYTKKNGVNEYYFSKKIYKIFMQSNTCILGYNNINFDDEITRNIFYRNFFDPYEWSWKNNNTRWDILSLLRACYALRPNGIQWPKNKLGLPSFKLSDLTRLNDITHLNAHNAISDVYATIEIAKLVKKKQPKLFNFFFTHRVKKKLYTLINIPELTPLVYISSVFGAVRNNISCIMPIIWDKNNSNILISIDLFANVQELIILVNNTKLEVDILKKLFNLGIKLLYFNRCPMLAPIQVLRIIDFDRLNWNYSIYKKNINLLKKNINIFKKIQAFLSKKNKNELSVNVDTQIYNAFFDSYDKILINQIRNTHVNSLKNSFINFHDSRLKEIFFRYRARNFFYSLCDNEKKLWFDHCRNIFNNQFLKEYKNKINLLYQEYLHDKNKILLLQEILNYFFYITKNYPEK
ncbi:exodeoxyribonuclease I [Buchnera aphidicola]|uniref:exodeoxyribonuclease I n=1 Tax=Buchnera aphidicola TaxID=9 RepID=UPI0034649034